MLDRLQRPIRNLRVSVTVRCNFRCVDCIPSDAFGPGFDFMPGADLLMFEEITRLTSLFVGADVTKVRLTRGEPLVRRGLPRFVERLAGIDDIDEVALTTNASLLAARAQSLADAGLSRVTVSLDVLDDATFAAMNGVRIPVDRVLAGIDAADQAGLTPIKVNMVVKRGLNDHAILDMAEYFRGCGHKLRFIEFMDVGNTNGWQPHEVVRSSEVRETIHMRWPLAPIKPRYRGEVATRYRYGGGGGEIGLISSVAVPFCGLRMRGRLSADGKLYTCPFATRGLDLRAPLRNGESDTQIRALSAASVAGARRSLLRGARGGNRNFSEDRDVVHRGLTTNDRLSHPTRERE